ncbi:MAG: Hpt domain-containing protein, partial [Polyangiaceae bacterium]
MITARTVRRFLLLPGKPTAFEADYLARVNAIALGFLWLHLPAFILVAWLNDTRPVLAAVLTSVVLIGPTIAKSSLESPRSVSVVHGVAAMFMGGLLVHFGQGPMQIEMHFYFFALLAMCVVFGNPFVILAAAFTVVAHHLVIWTVLPSSVFNYNASFSVVAVHAAFILLESTAACFIARSYFDNVIGLERIVGERTRDLRVLLDNVKQGLCTIDASGRMAAESSAAMESWFGASTREASWFDLLARVDSKFARRSRFAWDEVVADVLPSELTLGQMPSRLLSNGKTLHVDYHCIGAAPLERYLVVVTDVTAEVERQRQEIESREAMVLFEHALEDATAFDSFFEDGDDCIAMLRRGGAQLSDVRRRIHTLKGNALVFGLESVASFCHVLETVIDEQRRAPTVEEYRPLFVRWDRLARNMSRVVERRERAICLDEADFAQLLATAEQTSSAMASAVGRLRLEPIRNRLRYFAEQAHRIGCGLGKELDVRFEDHGERVDAATFTPLWNAFIHVIRNAVDHGI